MIEITDETELTDLIAANHKLIALFYSSWCPFCRNFLSTFDNYAKKPSNFTFIKVRVDDDDNPLWETYALEAVPSAIFFENGEVKKRLDCVLGRGLNEQLFRKWIEPLQK